MFALDIGARLTLVDLLVANDDNVPATIADLPSYRAKMDTPHTIALDAQFEIGKAMLSPRSLPFFVLIDRRTMTLRNILSDPDPDLLYLRLHQELIS